MSSARIYFRDLNTLSASAFWVRRRFVSGMLLAIALSAFIAGAI